MKTKKMPAPQRAGTKKQSRRSGRAAREAKLVEQFQWLLENDPQRFIVALEILATIEVEYGLKK